MPTAVILVANTCNGDESERTPTHSGGPTPNVLQAPLTFVIDSGDLILFPEELVKLPGRGRVGSDELSET